MWTSVLFFMFDFNLRVSQIFFFFTKAGLVHKYIVDVTLWAYFHNLLPLLFTWMTYFLWIFIK